MQFTRLGRSGPDVSHLAIGTMTFGSQMDEKSAHRLLDEAHAAGVNFFDTAEVYPAPVGASTYGLAELILGRWLKRVPRDQIIVSSKVAGGQRLEGPYLPWVRGGATAVDVAQVCAACDGSLQRLGTDYIDIYQPHWPEQRDGVGRDRFLRGRAPPIASGVRAERIQPSAAQDRAWFGRSLRA